MAFTFNFYFTMLCKCQLMIRLFQISHSLSHSKSFSSSVCIELTSRSQIEALVTVTTFCSLCPWLKVSDFSWPNFPPLPVAVLSFLQHSFSLSSFTFYSWARIFSLMYCSHGDLENFDFFVSYFTGSWRIIAGSYLKNHWIQGPQIENNSPHCVKHA